MAFKGEISVGMLNSLYKTGFSDGDVYRCYDSGNLVPNNFPVKHGDFVEWDSGKWIASDIQFATNKDATAAADKATGTALEGDIDDVLSVFVTSEVYATYTVGDYYSFNGTICKCTNKTTEDDKYIVELTQEGATYAFNELSARIAALEG